MKISPLSLGTWKYETQSQSERDWMKLYLYAYEKGVTFFDTANNYTGGEAEVFLGKLADFIGTDKITVSTKCYFPSPDKKFEAGLSREKILHSVHGSLRRLNVDCIDLLQCHRWDAHTPIEETIETMQKLMEEGKILDWGLGACSAAQMVEACWKAEKMGAKLPVTHQHVYNMFNRTIEGEISRTAQKLEIGMLVYSPLAQGVLSGKYAEKLPENSRAANDADKSGMWDFKPEKLEKAKQLNSIAELFGVSLSTLALAWCMRNSAIHSVITFTKNKSQLDENLQALDLKITPELEFQIEQILQNKPIQQYTQLPLA